MANIQEVTEWLKKGEAVRTPDMDEGHYLAYNAVDDQIDWHIAGENFESRCAVEFELKDFTRTDWEIYAGKR